tara:strand:+ start:472 stop:732 length:261 start_codon:yes stop_codon:yes gene_type:complete
MTEKEQTITFDNETYNVADLSEQTVQNFNILLKMQNEANEQSYQLSKTNVALETMSERFKGLLDEQNIKPVKDISIVTETKKVKDD